MQIFIKVIASFWLSFLINYLGLLLLRKCRCHQTIRLEGPKSHYAKNGTPTMGGIMIIFSVILSAFLFLGKLNNEVLLVLALFAGTGLIGLTDDWLIIKNGKNNGLKPRYKLLGQFIIAALFCVYLLSHDFHNMVSPFLRLIGMHHPVLYVLLSSVIIIGTSNAVNLTDGLDGLAAGVSTIVFLAFAFIAFQFANLQLMYLALFAAAGVAGFLVFNIKPAKIFMGDVGSLALGTLLAGFALLLHAELYLFLVGIVFVVETLSVILQVGFFKITKGRRIFKMSPLHHHFELCGFSENRIVFISWAITVCAALLAIAFRIR